MKNNVDIIKGLALRIKQNYSQKRRNKKIEQQLFGMITENFNKIIAEPNNDVFVSDFENLISNSLANPYITSNFFPSDFKEYGSYRPFCEYTRNFRYELRWIAHSLKYYAEPISAFVAAREEYDNYVLLNKYEEALNVVEVVEDKFGVSLWSAECKLFLYPKMNKNIKELMESALNSLALPVFNFYEFKNRDNVTDDEYFYVAEKEIRNFRQNMNGSDSVIDFYKYVIEGISYIGEVEEIANIMEWVKRESLIDQYLFFVDICDYAVGMNMTDETYICVKEYIHELSDIVDEHLTTLRFVFDEANNRKNNYKLKNKLEVAKEAFIKGDLSEAREKAVELLNSYPNNIEAISLLVDINILLDDNYEVFCDTNLGTLIKKMRSVYSLDEKRDDEIGYIYKFANCLSWSSWSKCLRNTIEYRCQGCESIKNNKIDILANLQYLDIETVIATLANDNIRDYLTDKTDEQNQYIAFRKACCERKIDEARKLCGVDQINDLLFVCDSRNKLNERIERLGEVKGNDAAIAIMRIKHFLADLNMEKNYEIISEISAKLIVENIYTSTFLPLEKMVDYIDDNREARRNICAPILYYVYSYYMKKEKKDDLAMICEDFLIYNNIIRPSRMDIYEYGSKELVIFFLKEVCNTKVMDMSVMDLENSQDRDQERVEICNVLSIIDPGRKDEYEKEIRETTQRLMINKEHRTIEENKIHVNIDGIKEKLIKEYKNDYARYKFYKDILFEEWSTLAPENVQQLNKDIERILIELVYKVRNAFVSSDEYGLDFYLSLNIRHGLLADELRGPLVKSMLTAKKDVDTNEYIINQAWLRNVNAEDKAIITKIISDFYIETEEIITKLKSKYIQIRTEEKNIEGVFDYTLSKDDIDDIRSMVNTKENFEGFVEAVIAYMWRITEDNLEAIKYTITSEISRDYENAFDTLKSKLSKINNKERISELLQKVNEAATNMPNVLSKICYWFQRSTNSKHNDFDIQFAFDTGLQIIKNIYRQKEFIAIPKTETISDKIPGCYFEDYNSIFSNLFANINKYAKVKNNRQIEIRYELRYQEEKTYIYMENDIDCSKDLTKPLARIKEQKEIIKSEDYKKMVKGEGGTGIPKICNVIASNIRKTPQINYDIVKDKNLFFIEISF